MAIWGSGVSCYQWQSGQSTRAVWCTTMSEHLSRTHYSGSQDRRSQAEFGIVPRTDYTDVRRGWLCVRDGDFCQDRCMFRTPQIVLSVYDRKHNGVSLPPPRVLSVVLSYVRMYHKQDIYAFSLCGNVHTSSITSASIFFVCVCVCIRSPEGGVVASWFLFCVAWWQAPFGGFSL